MGVGLITDGLCMPIAIDLTGKRFGRLIAVERLQRFNNKSTYYKCLCDCGKSKEIRSNHLTMGATNSCGCLQKEMRGKSSEKNLVGERFGRLVVLERLPLYSGKRTFYKCLCDCDNTKNIVGTSLISGITKSCGCYHIELLQKASISHNMTGSKELKAWYHMHERCYIPSNKKFKYYGKRGIRVCSRWLKDNPNGFLNFLQDMGYKQSKELTLHRIDNDKDYTPDNCLWASYEVQNNCRSNSVKVILDGKSHTKKEAALLLGVSLGSLERLQAQGYTLESIVLYYKSGSNHNRNKSLLIKRT
jgi:hypothetical protein